MPSVDLAAVLEPAEPPADTGRREPGSVDFRFQSGDRVWARWKGGREAKYPDFYPVVVKGARRGGGPDHIYDTYVYYG